MNNALIILTSAAAIVFIIFSAVITVKYYKSRKTSFDGGITGCFIIPDDEENAEIILRELISYIKINEINCFDKIIIKIKCQDQNVRYICRKICEEYPLLELEDELA